MSSKRICTACLLPKSCIVRRRAASTGAIVLFHSAQPGPCRHFFHSSLFRSPAGSSRAAASNCGKARMAIVTTRSTSGRTSLAFWIVVTMRPLTLGLFFCRPRAVVDHP